MLLAGGPQSFWSSDVCHADEVKPFINGSDLLQQRPITCPDDKHFMELFIPHGKIRRSSHGCFPQIFPDTIKFFPICLWVSPFNKTFDCKCFESQSYIVKLVDFLKIQLLDAITLVDRKST